ncbi:MAG TPA: glycosyltransferase family 2 protein [Chloroflexota bacterium]|jgi:GT2 family glycosyltransferase
MGISIVILNFNTRAHLAACLRSVQAEVRAGDEVFVVDNSSSDGSVDIVERDFPWVRLIRSPVNGGFAHGNNQALRLATREAVLLLNPDTILPVGALNAFEERLASHPDAGILGPKLLKPNGTMHLACRRSFPTPAVAFYRLSGLSRLFPRSPTFGRYNLTYIDPDKPIEVDAVCGACLLIRRSVVERIGLLDERFFMYGEDVDWCLRARQDGWTVRYEPAVIVQHQHGAASRQRALRTTFHFFRAMDLFYRKHYVRRYHPLVTGAVRTAIYGALAVSVCRTLLTSPSQRRVGL